MISVCRLAIFALIISLGTFGAHAAVLVSTSAMCGSPPSTPNSSNDASAGVTTASAISDLDCIFDGDNTGFATGVANGSIAGATHLDLQVMGISSADTSFTLVPGREDAFQSALASLTVALDLVVTGGAPNGVLVATASQCEMLAGVFGEFRVTGLSEQNLAGCGVGTSVFASYVRDVPFQISWFVHAEAFSAMDGEADDVGRFAFGSFELLTPTTEANPDASLALLNIPEPSSFWMMASGLLAALSLCAFGRRGRCVS
jgi:hypothetical protein